MPPNLWKRFRAGGSGSEVSRLLAGLRPPEQRGSLVVQTGFPTSLADLVVKNRGRLKKPSRRKKPQPSKLDSSVLGSVVSSSAAASAPPFNVSPRPGPFDPPAPEVDSSSLSSLGPFQLDEASNGDADASIEAEENTVSNVAFDEVSGNEKQCIKLAKQDRHETKFRNSQVLVFWAVALLGLLGGKTSAIVLTASWYLLSRPIEFLRKKGMNLFVLATDISYPFFLWQNATVEAL
ncbi:hypothetical protein ZIOFF_067044 [Zingiber officinale]|uniref:Uncharacterized protein n=1 Tax=Zingiber officinale TaxID=94328 RepID=A0A8J5C5N7_ZINOF|nr:hypothetical protein ZIOFF_067044 [Zingiber officinale]